MTRTRGRAAWFRRLVWTGLLGTSLACGDEDARHDVAPDVCAVTHDGTAADLLGFDNWEALAEPDDPWVDLRDTDEVCDTSTPLVEEGTLEFDTKLCGSYSVRAPLLAALQPGDVVTLVGSHSTLLGDAADGTGTAASGHLEVRVDGVTLFAFQTPIPQQADVITLEVTSTVCASAGADLQIHVRNHGANSWRINQIRRQRR